MSTSPDSPPAGFGRTRAQSARAAVILALLGGAAVLVVNALLTSPRGPLGAVYTSTGLPEWLLTALGGAAVLFIAVAGYGRSVREAPHFEIRREGLHVSSAGMGAFTLEWKNIAEFGATPAGLGVKIKDRETLVRTHQGTPEQRQWLRTVEPFGQWDLLFPAADLGHSPFVVSKWLEEKLVSR